MTQFPDRKSLFEALAATLASQLSAAVSQRGVASLIVPGGSTPVPLFHRLREAAVPWRHVQVMPSDERCVAESDPASNAAMIRRELLQGRAAEAVLHPLWPAPVWSDSLLPWDAVVVGMGDDGHFASLFPGNLGLIDALDVAKSPAFVQMMAPGAPRQRISMNLAALAQARSIYLVITGGNKKTVVESALARPDAGKWPVSALLQQSNPSPQVFWAA
jgi:6-phosphogluconolactonase